MWVINMAINLDYKKEKVKASYKSLYLKDEIIEKVDEIARKNDSTFNRVVANMIEYCVNEMSKES